MTMRQTPPFHHEDTFWRSAASYKVTESGAMLHQSVGLRRVKVPKSGLSAGQLSGRTEPLFLDKRGPWHPVPLASPHALIRSHPSSGSTAQASLCSPSTRCWLCCMTVEWSPRNHERRKLDERHEAKMRMWGLALAPFRCRGSLAATVSSI